jgi:hypothetical protein
MDLAIDIGAMTMRVAWGQPRDEVEIRPVAAGPLPWLGFGPVPSAAAGWDQAASAERVLGELLSSLATPAGGRDRVTVCTLAAPDAWWDGGPAGAAARETAFRVVRESLGVASVRFVPRTVAAAAWLAAADATGPERRMLVCDVGAHGVSASAVAARAGSVTTLDGRSSGGPAGGAAGAGFERALAVSETGRQAVRQALSDGRRRAAALLPRAHADDRYAGAPVYRLPGERAVDILASDVIAAYAPVAQALRAVLDDLLCQRPIAAGLDDVLLTGGLGGFPETLRTVRAALLAAGTDAAVRTRVAEVGAVARGALSLAGGPVRFAAMPGAVRLLAHRVDRGRLRRDTLLLPTDGRAATEDGAGRATLVEVGSGPHQIAVEAQDHGRAIRCVIAGQPPPPGRYEVGLWPAFSGAVLAFRPEDGGDPVLSALPGPLTGAGNQGSRRKEGA